MFEGRSEVSSMVLYTWVRNLRAHYALLDVLVPRRRRAGRWRGWRGRHEGVLDQPRRRHGRRRRAGRGEAVGMAKAPGRGVKRESGLLLKNLRQHATVLVNKPLCSSRSMRTFWIAAHATGSRRHALTSMAANENRPRVMWCLWTRRVFKAVSYR